MIALGPDAEALTVSQTTVTETRIRRRRWRRAARSTTRRRKYVSSAMRSTAAIRSRHGALAPARAHSRGQMSGHAPIAWTRDAVILAIQQWARENHAPPAQADWNPYRARVHLRDEERARRFERGRAEGAWPSFSTVVRLFGSWNAALRVAGFEPRAQGSAGRSRATPAAADGQNPDELIERAPGLGRSAGRTTETPPAGRWGL